MEHIVIAGGPPTPDPEGSKERIPMDRIEPAINKYMFTRDSKFLVSDKYQSPQIIDYLKRRGVPESKIEQDDKAVTVAGNVWHTIQKMGEEDTAYVPISYYQYERFLYNVNLIEGGTGRITVSPIDSDKWPLKDKIKWMSYEKLVYPFETVFTIDLKRGCGKRGHERIRNAYRALLTVPLFGGIIKKFGSFPEALFY